LGLVLRDDQFVVITSAAKSFFFCYEMHMRKLISIAN